MFGVVVASGLPLRLWGVYVLLAFLHIHVWQRVCAHCMCVVHMCVCMCLHTLNEYGCAHMYKGPVFRSFQGLGEALLVFFHSCVGSCV